MKSEESIPFIKRDADKRVALALAAGIFSAVPIVESTSAHAADLHKTEQFAGREIQVSVENGKKNLIDQWRLGIDKFNITYGGGMTLIQIDPTDTLAVRMIEVVQSDDEECVMIHITNTDGSADIVFITNGDHSGATFSPKTKIVRVPAISKR